MISTRHRKLFVALGISVAALACGAVLLPSLASRSNCGGNSAALAACKSVAVSLNLVASERGNKAVSITNLAGVERDYFKQIAGLSWLHEAKVMVSPAMVTIEGRQIVAVCDKPFDNVPRRFFGKAPLTHAVAYADGTTKLISSKEFSMLNLAGFVDVKTIQRISSQTNNSL